MDVSIYKQIMRGFISAELHTKRLGLVWPMYASSGKVFHRCPSNAQLSGQTLEAYELHPKLV